MPQSGIHVGLLIAVPGKACAHAIVGPTRLLLAGGSLLDSLADLRLRSNGDLVCSPIAVLWPDGNVGIFQHPLTVHGSTAATWFIVVLAMGHP